MYFRLWRRRWFSGGTGVDKSVDRCFSRPTLGGPRTDRRTSSPWPRCPNALPSFSARRSPWRRTASAPRYNTTVCVVNIYYLFRIRVCSRSLRGRKNHPSQKVPLRCCIAVAVYPFIAPNNFLFAPPKYYYTVVVFKNALSLFLVPVSSSLSFIILCSFLLMVVSEK